MAIIILSGSAATWTPARNPRYGGGYARSKERFQPKGMSDGGDVYSYHHGSRDGRTLEWSALPATDMTNLLTFMDSVNGGANTFQLTDYDASTHQARVTNFEQFSYIKQDASLYDVTIEIEVLT